MLPASFPSSALPFLLKAHQPCRLLLSHPQRSRRFVRTAFFSHRRWWQTTASITQPATLYRGEARQPHGLPAERASLTALHLIHPPGPQPLGRLWSTQCSPTTPPASGHRCHWRKKAFLPPKEGCTQTRTLCIPVRSGTDSQLHDARRHPGDQPLYPEHHLRFGKEPSRFWGAEIQAPLPTSPIWMGLRSRRRLPISPQRITNTFTDTRPDTTLTGTRYAALPPPHPVLGWKSNARGKLTSACPRSGLALVTDWPVLSPSRIQPSTPALVLRERFEGKWFCIFQAREPAEDAMRLRFWDQLQYHPLQQASPSQHQLRAPHVCPSPAAPQDRAEGKQGITHTRSA